MREPCPGCGGSGQISYFKGVSRFLLTSEECPECAGVGCRLEPVTGPEPAPLPNRPEKPRARKKKTKEKRS